MKQTILKLALLAAFWLTFAAMVCEPKSKSFKNVSVFYANTSTSGLNENVVQRFKQVLDSARAQKAKVYVIINDGLSLKFYDDESSFKNISSYLYENASAPVNYMLEAKQIREYFAKNRICASEKLNIHYVLSEYCISSVLQFKSDYSLSYFYRQLPEQLKEMCSEPVATMAVTSIFPAGIKSEDKVKEVAFKIFPASTNKINYYFQSI